MDRCGGEEHRGGHDLCKQTGGGFNAGSSLLKKRYCGGHGSDLWPPCLWLAAHLPVVLWSPGQSEMSEELLEETSHLGSIDATG